MLSSLDFDINVPSSDWLAWLRDLQYQRTTRFPADPSQQQAVVNVEDIITPIIDGVLAHQEEHARLFQSPRMESTGRMTRVSSQVDVAMVPFSPAGSDETRNTFDYAPFDLDASGPLGAEQRPRYNKAFAAIQHHPALPATAGQSNSSTYSQAHHDDAMFTSSRLIDGDRENSQMEQNQAGAYYTWDMPEDPYASHVPF